MIPGPAHATPYPSASTLERFYNGLLRDGGAVWPDENPGWLLDYLTAQMEERASRDGLLIEVYEAAILDDIIWQAFFLLRRPDGTSYERWFQSDAHISVSPLQKNVARALRPQVERDWGETLTQARRR